MIATPMCICTKSKKESCAYLMEVSISIGVIGKKLTIIGEHSLECSFFYKNKL